MKIETLEQTKVFGKPFVKWVGGKKALTDTLIKNLPEKF